MLSTYRHHPLVLTLSPDSHTQVNNASKLCRVTWEEKKARAREEESN